MKFIPKCVAVLVLSVCHPIHAAQRMALVIGNGAYSSKALPNPPKDAALIGEALRKAGFTVTVKTDLGKESMRTVVRDFYRSLKEGDTALFYYAGHGAEAGGQNYLFPVDVQLGMEEFEVEDRCYKAQLVLGAMEQQGTGLNVVVLDCCRDNPFTRSWRSAGGGGMLEMKAPQETLIAYATAPGKVALDGRGANSPYTTALAEEILRPGVKIQDVFLNVARRVHETTGGAQRPWTSTDILGAFYFVPVSSGTGSSEGLVERPAVSPRSQTPSITATREAPYRNGLGMTFVPTINCTDGSKVYFCQHETRVNDYKAYAVEESEVDGAWKSPSFSQTGEHPVVCVNWEEAKAFCAWLTKTERASGRIGAKDEYRLPRDHEWSLAVGIGEQEDAQASPKEKDGKIIAVYPWGGDFPPGVKDGNFGENKQDGYEKTAPVMSYQENRLGLHDLGGNVWEWCEDWYDPADAKFRVLRGGSFWLARFLGGSSQLLFKNKDFNLSSSFRCYDDPSVRFFDRGFRCVLVVAGG